MSWTCFICGASITTDNAVLFSKLVDAHQSRCKD